MTAESVMTVVRETTVLKSMSAALPISGLLLYLDRGVAAGAALARDCCQGCPNTGGQCTTVLCREGREQGGDGQYSSREWLDSR